MRSLIGLLLAAWCLTVGATAAVAADAPHNLVLFVPDGLRSQIVDERTAPTFARLRDEGVNFMNSHSLFPTFTTANASAFATGHYLGDTGDFSNYIFTNFAVRASGGTVTPFLEIDPVLREVNAHFEGNYLHEEAIVAAAQSRMSTALVGKLGPVAVFNAGAMADGSSSRTLIVDDSTGSKDGVPLAPEWLDAIKAAGLKPEAPGRGSNGNAGSSRAPGTLVANFAQQQYFLDLTLRVILPKFKAANRPFVLVYWSRDPDGSQHNQGDSFNSLTPGINGPTSLAGIRMADMALSAIEQRLEALGLAETTNIVVAADHGFSTIAKDSQTSLAAKGSYPDVNAGELPVGFLAIDLTSALKKSDAKLRLFDPDDGNKEVLWSSGAHPQRGNGLIGVTADEPKVVVAANGNSDLVYIPDTLPKSAARKVAAKIVAALVGQDYVSGLFVDTRRFGEIAGALSMNDVGLIGGAVTPVPAIVVNFASRATGCDRPVICSANIADTTLQKGQGMHGSLSRADTWNFMAARGPDFRARFTDPLPASNADIGRTIARLLQLEINPRGKLQGRVLSEALNGAPTELPKAASRILESKPAANGLKTVLRTQSVADQHYFDAAGFPGRTVGLE
jgi:Type I phosphodiesterase / nucleotide pyrophosphatase